MLGEPKGPYLEILNEPVSTILDHISSDNASVTFSTLHYCNPQRSTSTTHIAI